MSRTATLRQLLTSVFKDKMSRCYRSLCTTASYGHVREAVLEDSDAVMAIDYDSYAGRDFLPHMYPALIQNPNIHTYVFEINNHVVAFETAHVVDAGLTIATRGSRIKDGHQKNVSIMQQFRQYIRENLAKKHSSKSIAMTTSNTSGLANNSSFLQYNKEVLQRSVHIFPYETKDLDVPDEDDFSATKLTQLTTSQLCEIFQKHGLRQYLFPHGRFIINALPFRPMLENQELIEAETPYIIMSERLRSGPSPPNQGLISMTTWFSYKDSICVDLELYGCSSNFPEICNHIRRHLAHVRHLAPRGHIMVPHSYTTSSDALLCAFSRFGMAPGSSQVKTQYLFEETIQDV